MHATNGTGTVRLLYVGYEGTVPDADKYCTDSTEYRT